MYPVPKDPITDPMVLLDRMSTRRARLPEVSATARIEVYSSRGVIKGRLTLRIDPRGRLRVDAWTPTDDLVAAMTARPEGFRYFERGHPECLEGPACRRNLARLLPVGLDLADATAALLGFPPRADAASPWTIAFDRKTGAYRLESQVPGNGIQTLWVRDDGTPIRSEARREGRLEYSMEVEDFRDFGSIRVPTRLRFRTARDDTDLTVKYRSLEPATDAGDFDLACPASMPIRTLSCEDSP
jgi:hypothetical protein